MKVKYRLPYQGKFCCCSVYVIFVIILGHFGETGVVTVCGNVMVMVVIFGSVVVEAICGSEE